jgi:hypothetical protein
MFPPRIKLQSNISRLGDGGRKSFYDRNADFFEVKSIFRIPLFLNEVSPAILKHAYRQFFALFLKARARGIVGLTGSLLQSLDLLLRWFLQMI